MYCASVLNKTQKHCKWEGRVKHPLMIMEDTALFFQNFTHSVIPKVKDYMGIP